ncbi:MAG TPA: reverse transcriptase N-terminal domain-containing protein [Methanocorpusculum sp.]|nr:reverse transcriptase N-terminal domain-containing protein [Methanocorpusculum sp.]
MTEKPSETLSNSRLAYSKINWNKAEKTVKRLQTRIAKATKEKKWNKVRRLTYLLTHSYYAKLLAVRKVTTNRGKRTPGVDKRTLDNR